MMMNTQSEQYAAVKLAEAFAESNSSSIYRGRQLDKGAFDTLIPKMVRGQQTTAAIEDTDTVTNQNHDIYLKNSLSESIQRIRDNRNILELLPDTKLAIEIIIGTILSPKDMSTPTLTFKLDGDIFDQRAATITNYISSYFKGTYKLEDKLEEMLWDILGKTGSYPIAVLPETSVDYMINSNAKVTMESVQVNVYNNQEVLPSMGYLGGGATVSTENLSLIDFVNAVNGDQNHLSTKEQLVVGDKSLNLSVVDNFDSLKFPLLKHKISRQASAEAILKRRGSVNNQTLMDHRVASVESITVLPSDFRRTQKEKKDLAKLYPDRQFTATPILRVRNRDSLSKETVGHPLILKIPTEACIPVYSPTDTKQHIGYFIAIDMSGNPIRISEIDNIYKMLQTSSNAMAGGDVMSYLLQNSANKASPDPAGSVSSISMHDGLNRASYVYQELVEKELLERIASGSVGAGYHLGNLETPTLLMLSRSLAGKHTQLLYVPVDILSYLAIDYDDYGLGKTLLDDSKMLAALRSMNMVVNSIASSKNAITKRVLDVAIAPEEKNPQKALKVILQEYVKGTQGEFPLTNNPVDQINYLQMAGLSVRTGEHPRLPNTSFGVEYVDNQYKPIDTDYDDWLKKLHIQGIGMPTEILDGAQSADFATQVVLANVLTNRRFSLISKKFCESLSEHIRTYIYNSSILFDGIIDLIKSNSIRLKKETGVELEPSEVAIYLLRALSVHLPPLDTTKVKEQKEAFDNQADIYEEALKYFYSEEWLSEEEIGRLGGMEQVSRNAKYIKSHFMREWMKTNGVANELFDLLGQDKEGKPLLDFGNIKNNHMDQLSKALMPMVKADMKRSGDINAELERYEGTLQNPPDEGSSGGGDYSTSPSSDGGSGDSFDDTEFDDGMGDDDTSTLDSDMTETGVDENPDPDGDADKSNEGDSE